MPAQARSLLIGGREISYRVRRSPRARRLRVQVGLEHGVQVVLPRSARIADAERLLHDHAHWLLRHVDRMEQQRSVLEETRARTAREVVCYGRRFALRREVAPGLRPTLRVADGGAALLVQAPDEEAAALLLERWYRAQMRSLLADLLPRQAARMGVSYTRFSIRSQRSRWGSCSHAGSLSFNWRLAKAPPPVLDYVVIHELAHLREMNHSPRFWRLVEQFCPDYRVWLGWLRERGAELNV